LSFLNVVLIHFCSLLQSSKARLLHSLSSFLSNVAETISFSEEHDAVSARIGASAVLLRREEVLQLHELLFVELQGQTYFLHELSLPDNKQQDEDANDNFSSLNIEIVSQTLRCCLRMLTLVEFFDKSATLSSTRLLDGLLERLCHPIKLSHFLGLRASQDVHCTNHYQMAGVVEITEGLRHSQPEDTRIFPSFDGNSRHPKELVCAILEVLFRDLSSLYYTIANKKRCCSS
jgi:hypothetical protein